MEFLGPVLCMASLLSFLCFLKPWSSFLSCMLRVGVTTSKGTFIFALSSCPHLYDYVNDHSDVSWLSAKEAHLLGPRLRGLNADTGLVWFSPSFT